MTSPQVTRSGPLLTKKHEVRIQELRQERKSESQRLDSLKRILHSKLHDAPSTQGVRVA